jgi:hypothetical protein
LDDAGKEGTPGHRDHSVALINATLKRAAIEEGQWSAGARPRARGARPNTSDWRLKRQIWEITAQEKGVSDIQYKLVE